MKKILFIAILIALVLSTQDTSAQFDLKIMTGQYEVDLAYAESVLSGTRTGEERLMDLRENRLVLIVYLDTENNTTRAAMYNMGVDPKTPLWDGICVEGKMMEFYIDLDEIYEGKQRFYRASYADENARSYITIDPFYDHMHASKNSGQDLAFYQDHTPQSQTKKD